MKSNSKVLTLLATTALATTFLAINNVAGADASSKGSRYAKVVSNRYVPEVKGESRNVAPTGTNSLYTKPGTTKGAKLLLNQKQMKELGQSKHSHDYLRVYKQAVTNRGSVYYKVVTFDQKHRGWVYGGKTKGAFHAGIKTVITTNPGGVTNKVANATYHFKNEDAVFTRNFPTMTQYKVTRLLFNLENYLKDDLTVTKTAKRTREGSLYYYVTSKQHPKINGWIWHGHLTKEDSGTSTDPSNPTVPDVPTPPTDPTEPEKPVEKANLNLDESFTDPQGNSIIGTTINALKPADMEKKYTETVNMTLDDKVANTPSIKFLNKNRRSMLYVAGTLTITKADGTKTNKELTQGELDTLNQGNELKLTELTDKGDSAKLALQTQFGDDKQDKALFETSSQPVVTTDNSKVTVGTLDPMVFTVVRGGMTDDEQTTTKANTSLINASNNQQIATGSEINFDKLGATYMPYLIQSDIDVSVKDLSDPLLQVSGNPSADVNFYSDDSYVSSITVDGIEYKLTQTQLDELNSAGNTGIKDLIPSIKVGQKVQLKLYANFGLDINGTSGATSTSVPFTLQVGLGTTSSNPIATSGNQLNYTLNFNYAS